MWPKLKVFAVEPSASPVISGGKPEPASDPGHRRRLHPEEPARRPARRRDPGRGRGGARDGAALGARGGPAGRHLVGRDAGGDRAEAARDRRRARRCSASTTTPASATSRSKASCRNEAPTLVASLPALPPEGARPRLGSGPALGPMKPRILIVEDEPGIADTLQYALRTDGFEPALVRDRRGGAGADRARRRRRSSSSTSACPTRAASRSSSGSARDERRAGRLPHRAQRRDRPRRRPRARRRRLRRQAVLAARAGGAGARRAAPHRQGQRARPRRAAAATAARAAPIVVDEGRMQIRYYGRAARALALRVRPAKTLASRPGHVFTREALLERVWGNDTESMDRTVDAHVKTLRAKMKAIAPDAGADPDASRQRLRAGRGPARRPAIADPEDTMSTLAYSLRRARCCCRSVAALLSVRQRAAADPVPAPTYAVLSLDRRPVQPSSRQRPQVGTRHRPNERPELSDHRRRRSTGMRRGCGRGGDPARPMPGSRGLPGLDPRRAPVRAAGCGCWPRPRESRDMRERAPGTAARSTGRPTSCSSPSGASDAYVQARGLAAIGSGIARGHRLLSSTQSTPLCTRTRTQDERRASSPATPT